jgi:hypothetical protein
MSEESEFGKGLIICLVKFAEHQWRFQERLARNKSMNNPLFDESDAVEMFFNGASDHLYEIEVPKDWLGTDIDIKVKELQSLGLEIGHGFTGKKWTKDNFNKAYELLEDIALLIDVKLGLTPQKGQW